jgi:hypothetical protein
VDGMENIVTSAGTFVNVYRLRDQISSFGSTTITGDYIWEAPNVGAVQYATIDAYGVPTITARLSAYSLGR